MQWGVPISPPLPWENTEDRCDAFGPREKINLSLSS